MRKTRLFEDDRDYSAFLDIVVAALGRHPIEIFAYCVLSTHFHFLASPSYDGQLSRFMQWMTLTHSKRWHRHRGTNGTGCVYQGRFKAFPVQDDVHFLTVCRYVERNALRANLVRRAEDWPWGSAHQRAYDVPWISLARWPVRPPDDWSVLLNTSDPESELARIRRCIARSRPFGRGDWVDRMVARLAMTKSVGPIGRPTSTSKSGVVLPFS